MPRVPLTGGAYMAKSIIAAAQRCVNLYPEVNPSEAETLTPTTHYPRPGKTLLAAPPVSGVGRGAYTSSRGELFYVVGANVYFVSPTWVFTLLGTIPNRPTPVSMQDNGIDIVLVDGSPVGYSIDIHTHVFATITDPNFLGADRVDYLDTFLVFNYPGTQQFYSSTSNDITFSALDIAAKTGSPDLLATLIVMHKEIWLIGQKTSEVWYDSGGATFQFQLMPGAFIEHGTIAKYSVACQDLAVYWLSQDEQGSRMVLRGASYIADRISTHAIEQEWQTYASVSDAIGYTFQVAGHTFYVLVFPAADKTWVYDEATKLWHEWSYLDSNGAEHRDLGNCCANAYDTIVVGDYLNGNLYKVDVGAYTDNGQEIKYTRTFPHLVENLNRVFYKHFQADMEVGTDSGAIDGSTTAHPPQISLRISDDRGRTYGYTLMQSLGAQGQYLTSPSWWRLGMARDRVFELSWSCPTRTALNGAFIDTDPAGS